MKQKIIISPAKTFNLSNPVINGERPKYLSIAKEIFSKIKSLSVNEIANIYKVSGSLSEKIHTMHQEHNTAFYYAIEMYSGLVFKQLNIKNYDKKWLNNNVLILDALYGLVKPYDLISPYRLDPKTKLNNFNYGLVWKDIINKELEGFEIINLASNEYTNIVDHDMLIPNMLHHPQIKVSRGKTLDKIIMNKSCI